MVPHKTLSFSASFIRNVLCFFIFINMLVCSASLVHAADVYLKADIKYRPLWSTDSITLAFLPDEALCKKAYGEKKWKKSCTAWLGKPGTVPQGLVTTNWPEGEWRWSSSTELRFQPHKSWVSDTKYTVDLKNLPLPRRVKLSNTTESTWSLPRSAQMGEAKVWIDPSAKAEHAISFSMRFTESMNADARRLLESKSSPKSDNAGLVLSKGQWIWLDDNTRAVVNARILTLPKQQSKATLSLPGVRPLFVENNTWKFPDRTAVHSLVIPGTNSLFSLKKVHIEAWQNKSLQMEQHIIFQFSQRVAPEELLKALTILELPLHRDKENLYPSNWKQGRISPDTLKSSRKLQPQLVKIPDENEDYLRFRLDTTPGHYILWNVAAGFGPTNDKGIKTPLPRSVEGLNQVSTGESRVKLLQAGTVLAQNSDIALVSEHVDTIRWNAYRFKNTSLALPFISSLDDNELENIQLNSNSTLMHGEIAIAQNTSKQKGYTSNPVFTTLSAKKVFGTEKGGTSPGVIYLQLEGLKKGEVVATENRILMYSNMGMVLKKLPNNSTEVYVCGLNDANALGDVRVQILGLNSLPVAEVKTDASGKAIFPNMSHLTHDKKPTAVVARSSAYGEDSDMLWMSLDDYERNVNLSNFADIGGNQSSNALNAFVFAERGYFRPGEALRFGALLRANDWKLLPADMPLLAIIYDEVGRKVHQKAFKAGDNIHSFIWDIPQNALTGTYRLVIATPAGTAQDQEGIVLGSTSANVEMFVPDTLRIRTALVDTADTAPDASPLSTKGWIVTSNKAGTTALRVKLDTLFGQVAANRRITASMRLYPADIYFAAFGDYTFQDVSPFFAKGSDPITRPLPPTTSDAKGMATLPLDFTQWRFGTLQCTINTEGFEPGGGRAVSQEKRFLLSPLPYMLGFKTGEGADNRDFILKDSTAKLQFQAINNEVKPVNPGKLLFSIARRNTVTSLVSDSQGQYTYAETSVDTPIAQSEHDMAADGTLAWDIPTKEVGDYILTVKMPANSDSKTKEMVLAHVTYSIVGNDDLRPALKLAQNLPKAFLHIKSDKKAYSGGDTAKIMVTAPYDGVALISLERDSVAAHKWVKVATGNSIHELPIPENFTGRGYIQVLMGRSPDSNSIFLQPSSVAVTSVTVNTSRREQTLKIEAPAKALPGKTLRFSVKNTKGTATKALLFAVDEGILQLSKYTTPNPLNYLLLDRALEVTTAQLFDRLMAGDKKIMQRLSAFGGDGADAAFAALLGTFQNPFKRKHEPPVTWWSGVVEVPASGLELEIPIPDYFNGSLRLMVVANNTETVGSGQSTITVQDDHVLTPQVPTMASLGDSFEGALAIANTTDKAVTLKTTLTLDAKSAAKGVTFTEFPTSISLAPKEEKLLPFKVKAGTTPGEAILLFSTEDEQGVRRVRKSPMSIRPEVLPRYSQQTLIINQSTDLFTKRTMLPYMAKTSIALSAVPLPLLQTALNYLEYYPYDCVEQSISQAFPLAILSNTPIGQELAKSATYLSDKNIKKRIDKAANALIAAYSNYGGVSLWTDRNQEDLLLTVYAADYLLALKDAQLPIPPGIMLNLFNTLYRQINETPTSVHELRTLAYASWVLSRAGFVVSKQLELCEDYIKNNELDTSDIYHTLMAGAYATLYMQNEAQKHLRMVIGQQAKNWPESKGMFDLLAQYGLHAQVMAKHFPEEFQQSIPFIQDAILEGLNKPHATMGASMAARGLLEIIKESAKKAQDLDGLQLLCNNYSTKEKPASAPVAQMHPNLYMLSAPNCTNFGVRLPQEKKLYAQIQDYGYDTKAPAKALEQGLRITRTMTKSDDTNFTGTITQGEVLRVDVDVHLLQVEEAPIVMVDLLPGGFELVLDHKDDTGSSNNISIRKDEDRIIAFIDASRSKKRLTYHIRAITQGTFALPLAQAEGLFDRNLQSHTVGGKKVQVLAP